jgi:hypothetical protein
MSYKAFLSYSHAADGKLAPALQSALHRFAKPWYRKRAIKVFRDKNVAGRQSRPLACHRKGAGQLGVLYPPRFGGIGAIGVGHTGDRVVAQKSFG